MVGWVSSGASWLDGEEEISVPEARDRVRLHGRVGLKKVSWTVFNRSTRPHTDWSSEELRRTTWHNLRIEDKTRDNL